MADDLGYVRDTGTVSKGEARSSRVPNVAWWRSAAAVFVAPGAEDQVVECGHDLGACYRCRCWASFRREGP